VEPSNKAACKDLLEKANVSGEFPRRRVETFLGADGFKNSGKKAPKYAENAPGCLAA